MPDTSILQPDTLQRNYIIAAVNASLTGARELPFVDESLEVASIGNEHPYIFEVLEMFAGGDAKNHVAIDMDAQTQSIGVSIHEKENEQSKYNPFARRNFKIEFSADGGITLQENISHAETRDRLLMHAKDIIKAKMQRVISATMEIPTEYKAALKIAAIFGQAMPRHHLLVSSQREIFRQEQRQPEMV